MGIDVPLRPQPNQVPGGNLEIDRTHPLSVGLVACYVPGIMRGRDLTGNPAHDLVNNASYTIGASTDGPAIATTNAAAQGGMYSNALPSGDPALGMTKFSAFVKFRNISPDSTNEPYWFSVDYDSAVTLPYTIVGFAPVSGGVNASYNSNSAGSLRAVTAAYSTSTTSLAGTTDTAGNNIIYIDGAAGNSAAWSGSAPNSTADSRISLGGETGYAHTNGAEITIACIWNRVLSPEEVKYLHLSPYCFLKQQSAFDLFAALPRAAATYSVTLAEAGSAADTKNATGVLVATDSESGSAADTSTGLLVASPSLAESGTAADTESATGTLVGSLSETGSAASTTSATGVLVATDAETGAAAETLASTGSFVASIAENGSAADTTAGTGVLVVSLSETASAADTQTGGSVYANSLAESGSAAETASSVLTAVGGASETGSAADTPSSQLAAVAALAETGTASETTAGAAVFASDLSEAASAADTQDGALNSAAIGETCSAQDSCSFEYIPGALPVAGGGGAGSTQRLKKWWTSHPKIETKKKRNPVEIVAQVRDILEQDALVAKEAKGLAKRISDLTEGEKYLEELSRGLERQLIELANVQREEIRAEKQALAADLAARLYEEMIDEEESIFFLMAAA